MNNRLASEILVSVIFTIVLILFLNPFSLWMPETLRYIMLGGAVILFGLFGWVSGKEGAGDERERAHYLIAGRSAYILGIAVLLAGVIVQAAEGYVDPWIIWAIIAMVFARIAVFVRRQRVN